MYNEAFELKEFKLAKLKINLQRLSFVVTILNCVFA